MVSRSTQIKLFLGALVVLMAGTAYALVDLVGENQALRAQLQIVRTANSQQAALSASQSTTAASVPQSEAVSKGIIPAVSSADHIQGSLNADVILVEYSDYDCPFCKQLESSIVAMQAKYGQRFAWVYRQYPLPIHPNAELKSEVGECVASVGGETAFWRYSKSMFEDAVVADKAAILQRVSDLGVDSGKVGACLGTDTATKRVVAGRNEGTAAGVRGTPASFLVKKDGSIQSVPGALPLETFEGIVDGLLN